MANAQYWREQVARLHRTSRHRYQRRLPEERLPLRLRLRNDPTSAYRLRPTNDSGGMQTRRA